MSEIVYEDVPVSVSSENVVAPSRTRQVNIRLTEEEVSWARSEAERAGVSMSVWFRAKIFGG